MEEKNPIQVSDRLFLVLETLAETGPITLAALCSQIDLNKSTVHRLLCSLIYTGYVKQEPDNGKYSLSYKILTISNKMLNQMNILSVVRPHIKQLSQEIGETVHFVERDNTEAFYIYKEESYQNTVRMASRVGSRIPLYRSAVGKSILACLPDDAVRDIWEHSIIEHVTPNTITRYEDLIKNLEDVKRLGYAMDNEENELGVRCIAAAIPDYHTYPRYAFSVSVPILRFPEERIQELAQIILETKEQILKDLV